MDTGGEVICVFSGNGRKNIQGDLGNLDFFPNKGA